MKTTTEEITRVNVSGTVAAPKPIDDIIQESAGMLLSGRVPQDKVRIIAEGYLGQARDLGWHELFRSEEFTLARVLEDRQIGRGSIIYVIRCISSLLDSDAMMIQTSKYGV